MHKRNLAADGSTDTDLLRVANRAGEGKNLAAFGMTPPAAANRIPGHRIHERRYRPAAGFKHDAVLSDKCQRLDSRHEVCVPGFACQSDSARPMIINATSTILMAIPCDMPVLAMGWK